MRIETFLGIVLTVLIPIAVVEYGLKPAELMLEDDLINKGVIKKRDTKLFTRQVHIFYSKKIRNLNGVAHLLQENPISVPKLPTKIFQFLGEVQQTFYPDKIIFTMEFLKRRIIFVLEYLGEENGEFVYQFTLKNLRNRSFREIVFIYNVILTRIENYLKSLDDSIEVERKVVEYRTTVK